LKAGYKYAMACILLWGSTASISKLVLKDLDNLQVMFFTSLFATIALFFISLSQGKINIIKQYKIKDYFTFMYMGFFGVFLYGYFFYGALMRLPAQEAYIITYLWPIMIVILASIILKEKLTLQKLIALCISFIGITVVATKGNFSNFSLGDMKGILFAISGAISYGLFSILGKKINYESVTSMMFYYLFACIITVIVTFNIPVISIYQFIGLLWLGVFTCGLAYVSWFLALKYGDTAQMSSLMFLTPFLSLVYIHFFIGEKILLSSVIGLIIIILGILIQSFERRELKY
jgi:drug/metabolite transporter (DMT)-like permease